VTQFQIIGAGLPRTGTLSQKVALELLGFGPCYHMDEVLGNTKLVATWTDAFEGRVDWNEVLAGFGSSVDWPGSFYWRELLEAYPDAKVLLSVRDGDAWAKSIKNTIWDFLYGDSIMRDLSRARGHIDPEWMGFTQLVHRMLERSGLFSAEAIDLDSGELAERMRAYNQEVIDTVPAERLLVWSFTDGWEPLCAFLGVAVPEVEFPRVNDLAGFNDRLLGGCLRKLNEWRSVESSLAGALA